MKIGSWNERDNPDLPDRQVRSDARRVARRFDGPSIIGCQEIGETQDHRALHDVFGPEWAQVGKARATPILYHRTRFTLLDHAYVRTHGGIAGITPTRGFVKALFRHRLRPWLAPFWVYNTHLISKPSTSGQRLTLWQHHLDVMRADIKTEIPLGLDVLITGDFNRRTTPVLHATQHQLAHHWLDHIIWIPGTHNTVRLEESFTMHADLFTDHKPIGATLDVSGKS